MVKSSFLATHSRSDIMATMQHNSPWSPCTETLRWFVIDTGTTDHICNDKSLYIGKLQFEWNWGTNPGERNWNNAGSDH